MVKKETVKTKQSPMVLPAAHCAANGGNGTCIASSNILEMNIPRAGPNIRQTRKCVRYYFRLRALLY